MMTKRTRTARAKRLIRLCLMCGALTLCAALIFGAAGCTELDTLISDESALFTVAPQSDGTAAVTAYKGTAANISVPAIISGRDVTTIADGAFRGNTTLRQVRLPEGVSAVGAEAFSGCTSLENINLPMVTSVGDRAFQGCSSLEEADLGAASEIGAEAFSGGSSVKELTLGSGKNIRIGESAFSGCSSLGTVNGGHSAKYEQYAFSDCTSLAEVSFDSRARLAGEVFRGCSMLYTARFDGDTPPQYLEKWTSAVPTFPAWTTVIYSEQYLKKHRRIVYSDSGDSTRLFTLVVDGEGADGDAVSMEMSCPVDPANGKECIDCVVSLPGEESAAGWQFLNPGYNEEGKVAAANGFYPGCGSDLTGAKELVFYARTEDGSKRVTFFAAGIGREPVGEDGGLPPYPDSADRIYRRFTLTDKWQRFSIDVSQFDMSYIQCGFGFYCERNDCGEWAELYLDDIYFEGDFK